MYACVCVCVCVCARARAHMKWILHAYCILDDSIVGNAGLC